MTQKIKDAPRSQVSEDFVRDVPNIGYGAVLADPPWRFTNRTGKVAPEHKRLNRYGTLSLDEIKSMPVGEVARPG